jgi:hypothetical protein
MATDLATTKAATAAKYDAFVAGQLARAESRIRTLDLAAALLGFVAATLVYGVLMVLCDSKLELSPRTRQTALLLYLLGAGAYLALTVVRPLFRRINPYFAAAKVEATLPGAKNSVVNWVDLHDQEVHPAIRGAVGQRAARDMRQVNLERAISGRRTGWAGAILAAAVVLFAFAFFSMGPGPFASLLGRAFVPLRDGVIATRTYISVIRPDGGHAVVPLGRPMTITVQVQGKLPEPEAPDAVRLQFRHDESEPYVERPLAAQKGERELSITLGGSDVRNGFWYRVSGGDFITPEYRVSVRAAPLIKDVLATYHFRPYVARIDEVRHDRDLKALCGTEVVLLAHTNRQIKKARLEWEASNNRSVAAEPIPEDPEAFRVRVVLETNGRYRLAFTSTDGEEYVEPYHEANVIPDEPPQVEITKPAKDLALPADGLLPLEGRATDDIGVKSVVLRAQIVKGANLQPKPYRPDEQMRLPGGGYPTTVDYKDFLDLGKALKEDGKPADLKAGMELEYWLEAADACDFHQPHVVQSKHYKVQIQEPEKKPAEQHKRREQAEQDKKNQQQQQDQKQKDEDRQRQQERKQQEQRNAEERAKTERADKGKEPQKQGDQAKPGEGANDKPKDQQPQDKPQPKDKGDQGGGDDAKTPKEQDLTQNQKDQEQRLKEALDKQRKQEQGDGKGEPKDGREQGPGEAKGDQKQAGDKGEKDQAGGEPKGAGEKKDAAQGAGEGKENKAQAADQQPGEPKGEGKPDPMKGNKGDPKGGNKQGQAGNEQKAESKQPSGQGAQEQRAQDKPGGSEQQRRQAGQDKPEGKNSDKGAPKAENKNPGSQASTPEARKELGEKKDSQCQGGKCDGKGDKTGSSKDAATPKAGGSEAGKGDTKPSAGKDVVRGDAKPDGKSGGDKKAEDATPEDVARLAKDLQSKDEKTQQEAADKLEQIKEQARDEKARADAREALEKDKARTGEDKPMPGKGQETGDAKEGNRDGSAGSPKPMGNSKPDEKPGDAKGNPQPGQGDNKQGEAKPGEAKADRGKPGGANTPGGGNNNQRAGNNHPPDADKPKSKPSKPEDSRAAMLQLEEFKKKVDKNILKDAKMSEEDYKKFLRAYEERVRRLQEQAHKEQDPAAQPGTALPSFGSREKKPTDTTSGDVESDDRGLPPGPYRDPYKEFTKQMSQPAKKK